MSGKRILITCVGQNPFLLHGKRDKKQAINLFFTMDKNICIHGQRQSDKSVFSRIAEFSETWGRSREIEGELYRFLMKE